MANATLAWRTKHAGVKVTDIKKAVDKMVGIAKKVKDANHDGEAQRSELAKATKPHGARLAKTMETIRYGSGFWARDALPGGNPYFSYNEFVDDYKSLASRFKSMDKDKDGRLNAAELRGANSKISQSVIEYVTNK